MSKQNSGTTKTSVKKTPEIPVNLRYLLLLIAYGFVTVLTPNLKAFDSNGPKFLALALLNLATFVFLFTRKELKARPEWYYAFFKNGIGITYAGLMIVSLLSFLKAINVLESVLHFAKIFTVFSAAYLVSILIAADKRNIRYLCAAMTLLLVFDSLTVFSGIAKYIDGKISSVGEILSVYSNKNGLASAIFVKIPFALWLFAFSQKWWRKLGILGTFLAITATLFMSTRAFYLGIFALTLAVIAFFVIRYFQSHNEQHLRPTGIYLILLVSALLIFSGTQRYLYPRTEDPYGKGVGARLATISSDETSAALRLDAWKWSWHLIRENPILGVGLGNWKITVLKEANQTIPDYNYPYKAHNDFVETTTETGILGGLFYFAIFLITGWTLIRTILKNSNSEWLTFFYLPSFGLLCYSFDAMFNFPQDRPEIQSLFALFIGMAVAGVPFLKGKTVVPVISVTSKVIDEPIFRISVFLFYGLALMASTGILYQNFISLKLQRLVKDDVKSGRLTHPASLFIDGFPNIPDLNAEGEPIAVQKVRYLLNEKKNVEAIALLSKNNSSPWDTRPEFAMAIAYHNLNNIDSSLSYSKKIYKLKPFYFQNIRLLSELLEKKGLPKEGIIILDKYLSKTKDNQEAWLYASSYYDRSGNLQKAAAVIDTAANYFPTDSLVIKAKETIGRKVYMLPYQTLYNSASAAFSAKKYDEAVRQYSELLAKEPRFNEAHINRAYCYFLLKEYRNSIADLDFLISTGVKSSNQYNTYNLLGSNYFNLGNTDEACKNFKIAADMGDKDGRENYSRVCQPSTKK